MMNTDQAYARRKNAFRPQSVRLNLDVPLLLAALTLVIFGLLMVYSASSDYSYKIYGDYTYMFSRQLLWLAMGLCAATAAALFDYHYYRRLAVPGLLITIFFLFVVLIVGELRHGATRALSAGSYMPSEAAKIAVIIYLSVWLYAKRNVLTDVKFGLVPLAIIVGFVSGLIFLQPDLSAVATIIFLGGLLFFLAGGDLKQIAVLLIGTVLVGWGMVQVHPTGSDRIAEFLNGIKDPTLASYHVQRSIGAFVNGGFFGVGIGKAQAKVTGLPVPPTDSIFAVIAEETGIFGIFILICLYGVLIWRGLRIARRAPDILGTLLAAGITCWIAMEASVNMAVMIGLLPFAGNALPFISYGGSNLMVTMGAVGILLNISRLSEAEKISAKRKHHATLGVRRSDRRRDQSRTRRASGTW